MNHEFGYIMVRFSIVLLLSLAACASRDAEQSAEKSPSSEMEQSSGTVFFIEKGELGEAKRRALSGDNRQLQRLVDYYMFSYSPDEDGGESELQKWLGLAAERKLPGAAKSLLMNANEADGPDCPTIRKYAAGFSAELVTELSTVNGYLNRCLTG
ncbi:hypothetical protein [Blastomonas sp. CACIA14H2]|uniref:hypothetical protein n=1 Tax=Blastomonas sp. CACIA14H2 TaxID=1419876 RepID=UPI00405866F6